MPTNTATLTLSEISTLISETNDPAVLADILGDMNAAIDELEAKAELFKAALKDRLGDSERVVGTTWSVLKSTPKESQRLDTKALEADLGKDVLAGYYKAVKNSPRLTITATKAWEVAA